MYDVNTRCPPLFRPRVAAAAQSAAIGRVGTKALRIVEAIEYHRYLERIEDHLDTDWLPENGESNPFLHMSLHLSVQEQAGIDQPHGIRAIHDTLCAKRGW